MLSRDNKKEFESMISHGLSLVEKYKFIMFEIINVDKPKEHQSVSSFPFIHDSKAMVEEVGSSEEVSSLL